MKRIIFPLFLLLVAGTLSATAQYDYGKISAASNDYRTQNPAYTAFADRGGAFGLQNALYFLSDSYLYVDVLKGVSPSFGVYSLNGNTIGEYYKLVETADGTLTAVDGDGKVVKFKAGESVGFYYTDSNGKIVYDTPGLAEGHSHTYNGTQLLNQDEYVIGFGEYGQYIGSSSYDQVMNDSAFVMSVQVGANAPSGQPLPGVLATLLVGGTGLAFYRKRRKTA